MAVSTSDGENGAEREFNWSCDSEGRRMSFRNWSMSAEEGGGAELELVRLYNLE